MDSGIKGAVMYRAWVNSARELITEPTDRCMLYDAIFDLYFTGQTKILTNPVAQAVYTMVRPFVLEDVSRYSARCERNRQNAMQKRVAASGTQSQPVATNSNSNSNTKSSSNSNTKSNNTSLSLAGDTTKEEREIFAIYGTFFAHLAASVSEEVQRFRDYYDAVGWKTTKGLPVVSKLAAARQWEIKNRIPEYMVNMPTRTAYYQAFINAPLTDVRIWTNYVRIDVQGKQAFIVYTHSTPDDFREALLKTCGRCAEHLMKVLKVNDIRIAKLNHN